MKNDSPAQYTVERLIDTVYPDDAFSVHCDGYKEDIDKIKIHYTTALDFILNKIANIYELYEKSDITNPIEHVKGRIKKDNEIIRKLENKKLDINIENIVEHVNDFAGCKIVCSFINDIEVLKEEIKTMEKNGLLKIIKEKDYITNPKESGYRGYHFLVSVPIYLRDVGVINVKVEIQIRTVAMEMWASLEEKICYHKNPDDNIKNELVRTSNVIKVFDEELNDVVLKYNQNKIEAKKKMLV